MSSFLCFFFIANFDVSLVQLILDHAELF